MPKFMPTSAGLACLLLFLSPASASIVSPSARLIAPAIDMGANVQGLFVDHKPEAVELDDDDDPDDDDDDDDDEDDDDEPIPRPVTCESAKKIVKRAGFKEVGVRSCIGKTFRLTGSRNGYNLEIIVSRSGRILGTRRR